ncbi:MAG: ATP-binding protein [Nannocystaceae bacterium]
MDTWSDEVEGEPAHVTVPLPLAWADRLIPEAKRATTPIDRLRQRLLIAFALLFPIAALINLLPLFVADPHLRPARLVGLVVAVAMLLTPLWLRVASLRAVAITTVVTLNLTTLYNSAVQGGVAGPIAPFGIILPALAVLFIGVRAGWINAALLGAVVLLGELVDLRLPLPLDTPSTYWPMMQLEAITLSAFVLLGTLSVFTSLHTRQTEGFAADRDDALALSEAKSRFLSVMSHELRTPMVGVLGAAELLERTHDRNEQRQLISILQRSARAQLELIGNILDLSRIEADQLQIERASIDLRRLLRDLEAMFRAAAENKGLSLKIAIAEDIPPRVIGDAFRLQQVLGNLVNNAIKFTDKGEISVTARLARDDSVEFTVRDTGVGFANDLSNDIFATFVQADNTTARRFGGSGLGLAICRRLVGAMGGTIEADSVPGRGSTFKVAIPGPKPSDSSELTVSREFNTPMPSMSQGKSRNLTVLLADDEPVNRVVLAAMLATLGYQVLEARNGREALVILEREPVDAVLLDMHMPELDGPAVVSWIRANGGERSQLPVIGLTADVVRENLDRYLSAGLNSILSKPIGVDALRDALDAVFDPAATSSTAPVAAASLSRAG